MTELQTIVATRLRAVGQRFTRGRRALLDVLESSERPLTLPELLERDSVLAQSSAYRNLATLEQAGVVQRVLTSDDHARFELAEDLTNHHHHLVCSGCGMVIDFVLSSKVEKLLDDAFIRTAKASGFTLAHHQLDLIGICNRCDKK